MTGAILIVGQVRWTFDRLTDVRDDSIAPASNLITKGTEVGEEASPNWTLDHYAPRRPVLIGNRPRVFDHVATFRHGYHQRRVVEGERLSVLNARSDRLVDAAIEPDEVPARAER